MTEASKIRIEIARRVALAHESIEGFAASFVTGSSAEGIADDHSDIDMSLFFHEFPSRTDIGRVRMGLDPKDPKWVLGSLDGPDVCLSIQIEGIEVQYGITTVAGMNEEVSRIIEGEMGIAPEIKIAIGTLIAIPLTGDALIAGWQAKFKNYPENYREAALNQYLALRDLGELYPKIERRNAEVWTRRELSERTYASLAALAALNRVWFSEFQLKRSDAVCAKFTVAPMNLAERIRTIATAPLEDAISEGVHLFSEVRELVNVDTRRPQGG